MDYVNVDGLFAPIQDEGLATLQELRTIYTLEDALNFWEQIAVKRTNERLALEHAQAMQKIRGR